MNTRPTGPIDTLAGLLESGAVLTVPLEVARDLVVDLTRQRDEARHESDELRRKVMHYRSKAEEAGNLASIAVSKRCTEIADTLRAVHAEAYRKADLVGNEDAMCFIAGLRDGTAGVADAIRREFGVTVARKNTTNSLQESYCPHCENSHAGSCGDTPRNQPLVGIDTPIGGAL